jgi:hypothetical protein
MELEHHDGRCVRDADPERNRFGFRDSHSANTYTNPNTGNTYTNPYSYTYTYAYAGNTYTYCDTYAFGFGIAGLYAQL